MATQINLLPEVPPMGERLIAIAAERESKRLSARDSRWGETPEDVEAILVALRGIDAAMPKIEHPEPQP